jgi:hypothetical protein
VRLSVRSVAATAFAAAALATPLAGAAYAHTQGPDLATLQAKCVRQFDRRTRPLILADAAAQHAPGLSDVHRMFLDAIVSSDRGTVATTRAAILATTTVDDLRAACDAALNNLLFVHIDTAKVELTIRADRAVSLDADVQAQVDTISAALDSLQAAGEDVTDLRAALTDVQSQLDQVVTSLNGLGDAIVTTSVNDAGAQALRHDDQLLDQGARARHELVRRLGSLAHAIGAGD